ncbi:unnamed protein product, partial [Mesorhabditis spiculigera]
TAPHLSIPRNLIAPPIVDYSEHDGSLQPCTKWQLKTPNFGFDSYYFPYRVTMIVESARVDTNYQQLDQWQCKDLNFELETWIPEVFAEPTDHCAVYQPKGCEECEAGFDLRFGRGMLPRCRLRFNLKGTGDAAWARGMTLPVPQYCPSGTRRSLISHQCSVPCQANCLRCRNKKCEVCSPGFEPSIDSEICEVIDQRCKGRYFKSSVRCLNCPGIGCRRCEDVTGHCLECDRGRLLVISRFRRRCVLLCPHGTYLDYTTYKCLNCPPWCRRCDGIGCLRCSSGLYSLYDGLWKQKYHQCYYMCPDGYYPHNVQPLHCRPCDPSCSKCYGPSNYHCLSCRSGMPQIEQDSKIAFCPTGRSGKIFQLTRLGFVRSASFGSTAEVLRHFARGMSDPRLLGSFLDVDLNVCIQCTHPSKCRRCEWRPGAKRIPPNIPYQYPDDPADPDAQDRQICLELFRPEHLCDLRLHYLDANNTCLPCHPECKGGCTGEGSSVCKACQRAMDLDGAQFPFNRRYYWDAISHRRYLVVLLGIIYIFFQVLGMTGAWYLGEPGSGVLINWRDEEEVRQEALDDLERAWVMRSRSSSSGRPLPFAFSGSRKLIDYENDPLGNPLLMVVPVFIRRNLYPKLKKQGKKLLKSIESRSSSLTLSLSRSLHSGSSGSQSQERRPTMSSATGTTLTPTTATPTTLTRHTTAITGTMAPTTDPSASRKSTKSRHSITEPTASGYPSLPLEETISETQYATEIQPSVTPDEPSQQTHQHPEDDHHSMSEEL